MRNYNHIEVSVNDFSLVAQALVRNGYSIKCWTDNDEIIVIESVHPEYENRDWELSDDFESSDDWKLDNDQSNVEPDWSRLDNFSIDDVINYLSTLYRIGQLTDKQLDSLHQKVWRNNDNINVNTDMGLSHYVNG